MTAVLTVLTLLTVIGQFVNFWSIHEYQKVNYPLIVAVYLGYGLIELALALEGGWKVWIGLFVLLDLWALATALHGWRKNRR